MTDLKRKTKFTWDYKKNKVDSSPITAVQGEANSHVFEVSLIGDFEPVSDLKLMMYYKSKLSDNAGMVQFDFDKATGLFVVNVPAEMMQSSSIELCFTLEYEKEEEMLSSLIFTMNLQKSLLKNVQNLVDNNLSDFQKLFLATLPADVVDRITALQALIDKKADKTALDSTNKEVDKKATITSVSQKLPIVTADSTSTGLAYTVTNTNVPALTAGYVFKFQPNVTSLAQSATLSINGGTAYPFSKVNNYTGDRVAVSSSNSPVGFLKTGNYYTASFTGSSWILLESGLIDAQSITGTVDKSQKLAYKQLTEDTDIDTLTNWGVFMHYSLNNKVSNGLPSGASTYSEMLAFNGTQVLFDKTTGKLSIRSNNNNTWGTWKSANDMMQVGAVIQSTSSDSSGSSLGTWSNIGSVTVGTTVVYYWKRTA